MWPHSYVLEEVNSQYQLGQDGPTTTLEYETRSVFVNDKFVKLMQDVTRDKAGKDI